MFTCSICCEVAYDPVIVYPFEHIFCKICIRQALQVRYECPNDRIKPTDIKPLSGVLQRIYEHIPVKCPRLPNCCWKGTTNTYYKDHSINCPALMSFITIQEYQETISHYEQQNKELRIQNVALYEIIAKMKEEIVHGIVAEMKEIIKIDVDDSYS